VGEKLGCLRVHGFRVFFRVLSFFILGFRVYRRLEGTKGDAGFYFKAHSGLGFRVLGFRVLGFRVLGLRFLGFRVLGFRVLGF
jgi:hypothetical protein